MMNKRFEELAEQAKELAEQAFREDNAKRFTVMEKFAELIVRECADVLVAEMNRLDGLDRVVAAQTMDTAQVLIKQHFGVEE